MIMATLPTPSRLISASCSSGQHFASGFLQIRSRPRHPCLWLTLPLAGFVEDFHLQVTHSATTAKQVALTRNAPCLAHHEKSPATSMAAGLSNGGGRGRNRTGVDGFAIRSQPAILLGEIAQPLVSIGLSIIFLHLDSSSFGTFDVPDLSHAS